MEEKMAYIDVRKVLESKAPKYKKRIPDCLIRYLIRIVHQDELNEILSTYHDLQGVDFMNALIRYFDLTIQTVHPENIPEGGDNIFVSNHPLGGLDGICLSAFLGKHYGGQYRCLVNDLLLNIPNLKSIFVPINKHGAQGKDYVHLMDETYASDNQILTFPAGLCSRKINGKIQDLEWKKSFVTKAVEFRRNVVPIFFEARNSNFFYRLANIRKALGIRMNYEMIYLPNEMFKLKHATFRIHFGKAIPWQTFDNSRKPAEWAASVKATVYSLI